MEPRSYNSINSQYKYNYYDRQSVITIQDLISKTTWDIIKNNNDLAREFIEEFIELVEKENFNELFSLCPENLRKEVFNILHNAEILFVYKEVLNNATTIISQNGTIVNFPLDI